MSHHKRDHVTDSVRFPNEYLIEQCRAELANNRPHDALQLLHDIVPRSQQEKSILRSIEAEALYQTALAHLASGQEQAARREFNDAKALSGQHALRHLIQRRVELLAGKLLMLGDPLTQEQRATMGYIARSIKPPLHLPIDGLSPEVDEVHCLAAYRSGWDHEKGNRFSQEVRRMKDGGLDWLVDGFGDLLADHLERSVDLRARIDLIVPMPTAPERRLMRGYGIPERMALRLEARCITPVVEVFEITREAPELRKIGRSSRAAAIQDLYAVPVEEWVLDRGRPRGGRDLGTDM